MNPAEEALGKRVLEFARRAGCEPGALWIRVARWRETNSGEPELFLLCRMARCVTIDEWRKLPGVLRNRTTGKSTVVPVLSLDAPLTEGGSTTWMEKVIDPSLKSPERRDLEEWVFEGLSKLDPRDRAVLIRTSEGTTFSDLAEEFGVTVSRIGQLRKRALRRLRMILVLLD